MHLTESQKHASELISEYFKGKEQIISEVLSFDSLKTECQQLNLMESFIPEGSLDLHFDMILNKSLTSYYKKMSEGRNLLLEGISKPRLRRMAKALEEFQSNLNEQDISSLVGGDLNKLGSELKKLGSIGGPSTSKPTANTSTTATSVAPQSSGEAEKEIVQALGKEDAGGGYAGFLKSLWNTLTEGGSMFGVLHLFLDFVGLFGDFLSPIGLIADLLNAAIYLTRAAFNKEKRVELLFLGIISIIAAVIPVAGDVLKGSKSAVKPLSKVTIAVMRGTEVGTEALMMVPKSQRALVVKTLRFIAKYAVVAFAKASKLFAKLFDGIGKMVGIVPFIGTPLKKIFSKIGIVLTKASDQVLKFVDNFKGVEKAIVKSEVKTAMKSIEQIVESGGYLKYSKSGKKITAFSKNGDILQKFPSKYITDPKIWNSRFPGMFRKTGPQDIVDFYNFQGKPLTKLYNLAKSFIIKQGVSKFGAAGRFGAFVTKQVIKLMMNAGQIAPPEMSKAEEKAFGNVALNNWINDLLKEQNERNGTIYSPDIMLDSRNAEVHKNITEYQNTIAKMTGQPSIQRAIVEKTPIEEVDDEFQDLWSKMAKGEVSFSEDGQNIVKKTDESLIFIKSREDFLNS